MPNYKNNKEELVIVSDELVERAIELFEELKKASPSLRVSWPKLKRMLLAEGYVDAGSNESFRQLIKRERSKRGLLPSAKKQADLATESKIDALREEIGELGATTRESRDSLIKLNRLKREIIRDNEVLKIMENSLSDIDFSGIEFTPLVRGDQEVMEMVVCLSDIHYGARVDIEGNYYDQDIAYELLMEYADKVLEIAEDNNVNTINVVGIGDYIEHATMRSQNTYTAESHWSEQVIDISKIIVELLTKLSKYTNVTYAAIAGNHDRIAGDKNDNLYGDSAIHISNAFIEVATKTNEHITFIETNPYYHIKKVNGFNFLFVHGDQTKIKAPDVLGSQSVLHGIAFDALLAGHIHHFTMREVAYNKYVATFGSIKGSDDYSMSIGASSIRSQGIILVGKEDYEIRKVNL